MSFAASAPTRLNFSNSVCSTQGLSAKAPIRAAKAFPSLKIENRVVIRFTRLGRKRQAFYRLVAIDSKKRRDGLPIEFLGWYDPIKKESSLNAPAIKEWIAKGAQPSETAGSLLKKALIIS